MIERQSTRFIMMLVGMASVFIIIWGIQNSAAILNPILLAIVITIAVLPVPGKLSKRGLPGWLSLTLTILAVVGTILLVLGLIVFSIAKVSAEIPDSSRQAVTTPVPAATPVPQGTSEATSPQTPQINAATIQSYIADAFNNLMTRQQLNQVMAQVIAWAGGAIVQLFWVMLIFVFMLAAAISLPSASRMGIDAQSSMIQRVTALTNDVRHYINLMTVVNLLVGLGDTIFLYFMGVPYAILWGILSWLLGYIPSIGFWVALIPPVMLAYVESGIQTALIVFFGYVLINGSVQNIIQPKLYGQGLKVSPAVIFISLFVWGWLLGGIGAILAVPLTLMILSLLDSFESTRWLVVLVRATPERHSGEQQQAMNKVKGIWSRTKSVIRTDSSNPESNEEPGAAD